MERLGNELRYALSTTVLPQKIDVCSCLSPERMSVEDRDILMLVGWDGFSAADLRNSDRLFADGGTNPPSPGALVAGRRAGP